MTKGELGKGCSISIDVIYLQESDALRLNEKYVREENGRTRCDLKVENIIDGSVFLRQPTSSGDKDTIGIVVPLETILKHGDALISAKDVNGFGDYTALQFQGDKSGQVSHPSHYSWLKDLCGVEPLDICRHFDFNVGNAIKYLLRKDKVDGNKTKLEKRVEDLKKAKFYIEDEIKLLENDKD